MRYLTLPLIGCVLGLAFGVALVLLCWAFEVWRGAMPPAPPAMLPLLLASAAVIGAVYGLVSGLYRARSGYWLHNVIRPYDGVGPTPQETSMSRTLAPKRVAEFDRDIENLAAHEKRETRSLFLIDAVEDYRAALPRRYKAFAGFVIVTILFLPSVVFFSLFLIETAWQIGLMRSRLGRVLNAWGLDQLDIELSLPCSLRGVL